MAPTFLPFLAFIFYIGVTAITIAVFAPMLFINSTRLLAKKILITILIFFPCLITVAILIGLLFLLPALLFSWLADNNYIGQTPGTVLTIIGLFLFISIVAACSLYAWYFFSRIIYKLLEKRPVAEFLDNSKVFRYLQRYLKFNSAFFQKNGIIKILGVLIGFPIGALICGCLYFGVSSLIDEKPTQQELAGKYHISKITVANFDKSVMNKFKLEFRPDGTFELTSTPNIDVCNKGKYNVDYQFDYNEISFNCNSATTTAHIDRHWGYYRIEFIIGDPDSGESIFFEKDK